MLRVALAGLLLACLALPARAGEEVRVALALGAPHARVAADSGWTVKSADGTKVLARRSGTLRLHPGADGVRVDGFPAGPEVLLVPASGVFRYGGRTWRGHLKVQSEGAGLTLVDFVPLETYLAGVLGGELAPDWPLETQKALAVAARTYALYQARRTVDDDGKPRDPDYDVVTTVKDQVYPGVAGESAASRAAVRATRGEILSLSAGPAPVKAYYHSSCGGHTSDSLPVFGDRVPLLKGVADPYCGTRAWSRDFAVEALRRLAAPGLGTLVDLGPVDYDPSGRIARFRLVDGQGREAVVTGHELRMLAGPAAMRSTRARMAVAARDPSGRPLRVRFSGTGWGHGVGLCQWGAEAMGARGQGYREILAHYYPGTRIVRLP